MSEIIVNKRDGTTESLDLEKMHKVVFFAREGITGVSPSEVEIVVIYSFMMASAVVIFKKLLLKRPQI